MDKKINKGNLKVSEVLVDFIEKEVLGLLNLNIEKFRENLEYICKHYPNAVTTLNTMHGFPTETEEEANIAQQCSDKVSDTSGGKNTKATKSEKKIALSKMKNRS